MTKTIRYRFRVFNIIDPTRLEGFISMTDLAKRSTI